MTKESARKCSHCGHNGHNSRTCNGKGCGVKLFGVRIDGINNVGVGKDETTRSPVPLLCNTEDRVNGAGGGIESSILRKCKSLGNLQAAACNNVYEANNVVVEHGYLSDDHLHQSKRKKGTSWTESEHRKFLIGLKKLGKGDWRGISRNYVSTRTPTQVASHAQKYFIRMASEKKKRRSSVFDMPLKEETPSPLASPPRKDPEVSLQLSVSPPTAMKTTTSNIQGQASTSKSPSAALSEKPPLSPMARTFSVPGFHSTPHMVGYPSMAPRIIGENNYTQTVLFTPVFNYANNNNHFYPYDRRVAFATCSPFMTPPLLVQPLLPKRTSQTAKNDGLAAGIGALPLSI